MREKLRGGFCVFIAVMLMAVGTVLPADAAAQSDADLVLDCTAAVLMEATTGKVLYESNADAALPPASVTKIMTLLLVMEAIEEGSLAYTDTVTASEYAASMGGSQIYLEAGEQMSVLDLVKSVVIASANDAAVALAEQIAGTEQAFVERMNMRARELGMQNTNFENTNGLDDTTDTHLTSARDIAIMSRELIKHPRITEFSRIWMDTIRNGEFGLTNTNRLVRFYEGATGLKTGSTAKAGFCISATATRQDMTLIAVIMGAESRDARNAAAVSLLNYGFSTYTLYRDTHALDEPVRVVGGAEDTCPLRAEEFCAVTQKSGMGKIEKRVRVEPAVTAPFESGMKVGEIVYTLDGEELGRADIVTQCGVEKISFWKIFLRMLGRAVLK